MRVRPGQLLCLLALMVSLLALAVPATPASADPVPVNGKPAVVPALQKWQGSTGFFELRRHSRIVFAGAQRGRLRDQLATLPDEIEQVTGRKPALSPRHPQSGDIVLSIDPTLPEAVDRARFMEEGYTFTVTGENVRIAAPTAKGVYYGTRTLLQILLLDDGRDSVPVGTAVDWPNYKVRGFTLDVGRRFFTADFIRDYIRLMGWFKLNEFQIHLNDNGFKGDRPWSEAQAGFRLKTDNPRCPAWPRRTERTTGATGTPSRTPPPPTASRSSPSSTPPHTPSRSSASSRPSV
ncbi:glycoside hydrolase family 20 zincin-like fold domain-containing protein [Streptomyces sp. NPDC057565]|uniref:glycoside hydrolase family 20 zincin-like fold domain-containing protein n=1 Tax=Streptomyces sp. NPDC057565 TaxID=3346169 RepID=UPI0036814ADD